MSTDLTRRNVMGAAVAAGVVSALDMRFSTASALPKKYLGWNDGWNAGPVHHLLPIVNHERMRLKVSFTSPVNYTPELAVNGRRIAGMRADRNGRFWNFDVSSLMPAKTYELRLYQDNGTPLTDTWPLKTFPSPDATPERVRLLVYTCAGGVPGFILPDGRMQALPHEVRRRLLGRGLSFEPDAVISNGDQLYWDQTQLLRERGPKKIIEFVKNARKPFGNFDSSIPVRGTENEDVITHVADDQIADLYGVGMRSVPVFFLPDDHDYYDGDEANDEFVTFPPNQFHLDLARHTQLLYYPEFLIGPHQPTGLSGANAADRPAGLSEIYGVLRYGRLLEALLYDARRYTTMAGPSAIFVADDAEKWLKERTMAESDTRHLIHMPSQPLGWSAGKWMDWYPDVLADGTLTTKIAKPYWQKGWFEQHQRLVAATSAQKQRPAFFITGDMHMIGAGQITRSGDLDLSANPVTAIVPGIAGGAADGGWPSGFRGTPPKVASALEMKLICEAQERNGFTILDITPDHIDVKIFSWRRPEPEEAIDTLEPTSSFTVSRLS